MGVMDDYYKLKAAREDAALNAKPGPAGRKDDSGKLDITLVTEDLPRAIEGVAEVLQWAITKKLPTPYERGSWQGVPDFKRRYMAALQRHILNRSKSMQEQVAAYGDDQFEPRDIETGLLELAHIATDAMFLLEMAMREEAERKANATGGTAGFGPQRIAPFYPADFRKLTTTDGRADGS